MTATTNLYAAWIGILLGLGSGSVMGLFFHRDNWLGGYGSWRRRMLRLGHISFFGIGFINLCYVLTLKSLNITEPILAGTLLLVSAIGMPAVCFLSAICEGFRKLFFIPVLSVIVATGIVLSRLVSL
jgi:hypothetical protein